MPETRHITQVIYRRDWRDLFRKSYWVVCWRCDYRDGPWVLRTDADAQSARVMGVGDFERPWCDD
jgi:hypothetical protein